MKKSIFFAGLAVAALMGGAALAAGTNIHTMTIQLPGGGVEHIEYTGDVAPKVTVGQPAPFADFMPRDGFMPRIAFGPAFGDFARMQQIMDRQMKQMNVMIERANAMAAQSFARNGPVSIGAGAMPAGSESFQVISSAPGNDFCARSVEITTGANGKENVVRHESGNCGPSHGAPAAPAAAHDKAI